MHRKNLIMCKAIQSILFYINMHYAYIYLEIITLLDSFYFIIVLIIWNSFQNKCLAGFEKEKEHYSVNKKTNCWSNAYFQIAFSISFLLLFLMDVTQVFRNNESVEICCISITTASNVLSSKLTFIFCLLYWEHSVFVSSWLKTCILLLLYLKKSIRVWNIYEI